MRMLVLLIPCMFCLSAFSQKKEKQIKNIYIYLITHYYEKKPTNLLVADSVSNSSILRTNYHSIAEKINQKYYVVGFMKLHPSWLAFFNVANERKKMLKKPAAPLIKIPGYNIKKIDEEERKNLFDKQDISNINGSLNHIDYISFSDIIFYKKKAIVELNSIKGNQSGENRLYFLEKKKGKWKVASYITTSVI